MTTIMATKLKCFIYFILLKLIFYHSKYIKNCGVPAALRNISDRMIITADHLYSSHLLILMSPMPILQNARMNVVARRVLVMSGMLKSMAARRIM